MDLSFIKSGFAIFPIAYTMATMHGPFGLSLWLREAVCGACTAKKDGECCRWEWIAEGVRCPICWSFWIGMFWLPYGATHWLAAWGVATVLTMAWKGWNPSVPREVNLHR